MNQQEEFAALYEAARDQENALAAQAQELDGLLRELAAERDKLATLRRQYEADLTVMRPYVNALQRGASISIEYSEPARYYAPDEFKTLSDYHAPPRGHGIIP